MGKLVYILGGYLRSYGWCRPIHVCTLGLDGYLLRVWMSFECEAHYFGIRGLRPE